MGDLPRFKRVHAAPIERSRDRTATPEEKRLGAERSESLGRLVEPFMLRRTNEVNQAYLPKKREFTVFVRCSALQEKVYHAFLKARAGPSLRCALRLPI